MYVAAGLQTGLYTLGMRCCTPLLCVVGVLWSAAAAGQATDARALSPALRTHVQGERFEVVTSLRGLPLGVRDELGRMFGRGSLDIAEPGAPFQSTDVVVTPMLPFRRLSKAWCANDHCFVYYERGGIAHTWHAALFHWSPAATKLEGGGMAPGGLTTFDAVRNAIFGGGLKPGSW
jgi:hypothetical protein